MTINGKKLKQDYELKAENPTHNKIEIKTFDGVLFLLVQAKSCVERLNILCDSEQDITIRIKL